ncbi:MAG: glycosyltransferase [Chitinophagales bacterium]
MGNKVKIAFLTRGIDENPLAGPPVFLYNFISYLLEERSEEYEVFLFHNDRNRELDIYKKAHEIVVSSNPIKMAFEINTLSKKYKIDIFHLNRIPTENILIFRNSAKLLIMLHGDLFISMPEYIDKQSVRIQKYQVWLYNKLGFFKRVSRFISVSDSIRDVYSNFLNIPKHRFITSYCTVNRSKILARAEEEPAEEFTKLGLKNESFNLFVGSYQPIKNGLMLISLMGEGKKQNKNYLPLLIIGKNWLRNPLVLAKMKKYALKLNQDIYIIDGLANRHIPSIYKRAYTFINPSLHETFGLTNLEAMICSCPLITTIEFGAKELVGDAGLIIKNPNDLSQFMEKMDLIKDKNLRLSLIEKGKIQALKFDDKVVYNNILEAYKS